MLPDLTEALDPLDDLALHPHRQPYPTTDADVVKLRVVDGSWRITGTKPIERLLGCTAPTATDAVGLVTGGDRIRLRRTDERGASVLEDRPMSEKRSVAVVDRTGRLAGRLTLGSAVSQDPPVGRVVDGLRRSLGLSTPPPEAPAALVNVCLWMTLIGTHEGARLSWEAALHLHPAVAVVREFGDLDAPVAACEHIVRHVDDDVDWEAYRLRAVAGEHLAPVCPPKLARWFDEGSFYRWVASELPPLQSLLAPAFGRLDRRARQGLYGFYAEKAESLGLGPNPVVPSYMAGSAETTFRGDSQSVSPSTRRRTT